MSKRVNKINELIKKELGKIIFKEIEISKENLTTITRVQTTPNLTEAFVYISVIGENEKQIFNILQKNIYFLQKKLNKKLNMRPVPKIVFKKEQETENAEKIEKILEKIKKK